MHPGDLRVRLGSQVRKQDLAVAKNDLQKNEIEELDRIVVMYLHFAEDPARRRMAITMREWEHKLDTFLAFNERDPRYDSDQMHCGGQK